MAGPTPSLGEILKQYDLPRPRDRSYPTVVELDSSFGDAEYRARVAEASMVPAGVAV